MTGKASSQAIWDLCFILCGLSRIYPDSKTPQIKILVVTNVLVEDISQLLWQHGNLSSKHWGKGPFLSLSRHPEFYSLCCRDAALGIKFS